VPAPDFRNTPGNSRILQDFAILRGDFIMQDSVRKPTMKDVAALAGVTPATVSRVLSDFPAISEATRSKVRQACEELNYVPDLAARGLSGHTTHTIGLIIPDVSNPYFSGLAEAIEQTAYDSGYRLVLTNSLRNPDHELQVVNSVLAQQVDGVLISAYSPDSQARASALLGSLPCVFLGNNHGPACSFVEADNALGAYEAGQYLLRLGHRDILFLGGRTGSRTLEQRLTGFRRALEEAGVAGRESTAPADAQSLRQWTRQRAQELLQDPQNRPGAVVAYSDMLAMQVMEAAEACGIRIPEDLSLLGFDNISFGALPRIHLTSVSQRKFRQGRLAVERLLEKIRGETAPHGGYSAARAHHSLDVPENLRGENFVRGMTNETRQAQGARLERETQEAVMADIPAFAQAEIHNLVPAPAQGARDAGGAGVQYGAGGPPAGDRGLSPGLPVHPALRRDPGQRAGRRVHPLRQSGHGPGAGGVLRAQLRLRAGVHRTGGRPGRPGPSRQRRVLPLAHPAGEGGAAAGAVQLVL
jgi:LacI family transcriptional regulator